MIMLTTMDTSKTLPVPPRFGTSGSPQRFETVYAAGIGWGAKTRTKTIFGERPFIWVPEPVGGVQDKAEGARETVVAELRRLSGLSGAQLARLLGVSRRSIQAWIAGAPMAPSHAERVHLVLESVKSIEGSPEQRRDVLFDSSDGTSLFRGWEQQNNQLAPLHPTPYSPKDVLGS